MASITTIQGRVTGANQNGIHVEGREKWINFSKYHSKKADGSFTPKGSDWCNAEGYQCASTKLPNRDDVVEVSFNERDYVTAMTVLEAAPQQSQQSQQSQNGASAGAGRSWQPREESPNTILRMARFGAIERAIGYLALGDQTARPAIGDVFEAADQVFSYLLQDWEQPAAGGHKADDGTAGGVFADTPDMDIDEFIVQARALGLNNASLKPILGIPENDSISREAIVAYMGRGNRLMNIILAKKASNQAVAAGQTLDFG